MLEIILSIQNKNNLTTPIHLYNIIYVYVIPMDISHLVINSSYKKKYEKYLNNVLYSTPSLKEAVELSKTFSLPLHPKYIFYFSEVSPQLAIELFKELQELQELSFNTSFNGIQIKTRHKSLFECLGLTHKWVEQIEGVDTIVFDSSSFCNFLVNCNVFNCYTLDDLKETKNQELCITAFEELQQLCADNLDKELLEIINMHCDIEIRDKAGSYIGARMGRPEKAKMRKLDGRPQGLFMIGNGKKVQREKRFGEDEISSEIIQNRMRNIIESYENGTAYSEYRVLECESCGEESLYPICVHCKGKCVPQYFNRYDGSKIHSKIDSKIDPKKTPQNVESNELAVQYKRCEIELKPYIDTVRERLQLTELPKLVKGIRGTSNEHRTIEVLDKAFLRSKYDLYVNKDGTIRYDMIEMGITHFKAKEIGTSIETLKKLGYYYDYLGNELVNDSQIIEIFPQDVILPDCSMSEDEIASETIINIGKFIDESLEKLYHLKPFYNFKTKEDTIGHLIIGLAPHTSAGIIGRIIGYSKTQGCFSHPVWHAAQRRNLDGDENGIMLLLDGLLNGSREFLPNRRGSKTMDVSLVLTAHLYLDQIDDEVHGMDIVPFYPLEFYRFCKQYESPKNIKIEKIDNRLGVKELDKKYLSYFFTHDNTNLNNTILCSAYKTLPSMAEKLATQLDIGKKIRAVNEHKVGELVIDKHFMKDIKGNLRKFGMQNFRCTSCNTTYRRPPLNGRCSNCFEASINFTIHEGSIKKYLSPSFNIAKNYDIDPYIVESLELVNLRMEGVFGKEIETQKDLNGFFR